MAHFCEDTISKYYCSLFSIIPCLEFNSYPACYIIFPSLGGATPAPTCSPSLLRQRLLPRDPILPSSSHIVIALLFSSLHRKRKRTFLFPCFSLLSPSIPPRCFRRFVTSLSPAESSFGTRGYSFLSWCLHLVLVVLFAQLCVPK